MSVPDAYVRSWYAATAHPHPPYPALEGAAGCDVLVVGGGYTGLSAALHLAERGYDVVLLEARRVGWGASGRNGGQIITGFNRSMEEIASWVGREDARRLWDLALEAKALLRDRVERHGIACDLRSGHLLAGLKPRHWTALRAMAAEWRDVYGYDEAELLDRDAVRALVDCPRYGGGLLDHGGGQLHPLNYALGLAAAARAAGVRIFETSPVERLEIGPLPVARTPRGSVTAHHVALAGNAYLGRIAPAVDRIVRTRIMPVGTYITVTEPLGAARARALIPSGLSVADINFALNYYRLTPDHRMLFGGGVSYSRFNPPYLARALKRTMARFFPSLADVRIDYVWGGHVAITMNRTPQFGRVAPNVFFAHGYSGHGVALSGLAGKLIAEAIAGTAERFDVFARLPHAPFPGGRLLRTPTLVLAMARCRLLDLL